MLPLIQVIIENCLFHSLSFTILFFVHFVDECSDFSVLIQNTATDYGSCGSAIVTESDSSSKTTISILSYSSPPLHLSLPLSISPSIHLSLYPSLSHHFFSVFYDFMHIAVTVTVVGVALLVVAAMLTFFRGKERRRNFFLRHSKLENNHSSVA
jgi:hypothetical protein